MTLYQRIRVALQAAWQAFNQSALIPNDTGEWDDLPARLFRYEHYRAYYFNSIYSGILRYASAHKSASGLYRHTRSIYNPVARQVDFYVAQVFGGLLDLDTARDGAIPIMGDEDLRTALVRLWQDSAWQRHKSLFVRNGAMYGDTVIKVVEDQRNDQVRLEVLPPNQIADVTYDGVGNVVRAVISQIRRDPINGTYGPPYLYTEEITPYSFVTRRDGEEYAFYQNFYGKPLSRWENRYGFVPLIIQQHKDVGQKFGASPFHNALGKIDAVNDLASNLHDQIRKSVNVIWAVTGVNRPARLEMEANRDDIPFIYIPSQSSIQPLVAPLDIQGSLAAIQSLLDELERDLPELALASIRANSTPPSGTALSLLYQDATNKVQEARGAYAAALTKAQAMALYIGAINAYPGYTHLMGRSLADLHHQIAPRPVFSDTLTRQQRIQAMQNAGFPLSYLARELGFSAAEADGLDSVTLADLPY